MSTIALAAAISFVIVTGAIIIDSDPEFVQTIKQTMYQLILAGYKEEKILYIMHLYS
jgi:hypothetical protein